MKSINRFCSDCQVYHPEGRHQKRLDTDYSKPEEQELNNRFWCRNCERLYTTKKEAIECCHAGYLM